jgi:hypothetical protein
MKKLLLLIYLVLLSFTSNAQVLFTDDFESYTLGNLGTNTTGAVAGKGGWYSYVEKGTAPNNSFYITTDATKGKVLALASNDLPYGQNFYAIQQGLDALIDQRLPGNNVIMFQVDFYTIGTDNSGHFPRFGLHSVPFTVDDNRLDLFSIRYNNLYSSILDALVHFGFNQTNAHIMNVNPPVVPKNAWVTVQCYLDYDNKRIYIHVPIINYTAPEQQFLQPHNTFDEFKPHALFLSFYTIGMSGTTPVVQLYDNVLVSAMAQVPAHVLSSARISTTKFNIYPNPASNLVTITNADNLLVQQVTIYDMAGKQLSTQTFNTEAEVQLNVAHLANGTYLLHIQTTQGTAVKQLIKK